MEPLVQAAVAHRQMKDMWNDVRDQTVSFGLLLHMMDKTIKTLDRRVQMNKKNLVSAMPVQNRDITAMTRQSKSLSIDTHLKGDLS
jgi:hypothetical protein